MAKPIATAVKAPPFQIAAIGQSSRWMKLLVYGAYGVGKTQLVGSSALVPQMRDILMIDAEAGDLTIAAQDEKSYTEAHGHIDRIRITSYTQLARVQEYLKIHCKLRDDGNDEKLKEHEKILRSDYDADVPPRKYNTIIVDSLSEVETFSLYQLLGITDATKLDDDTAPPEFAEYKKNNNQVLRLVRSLRDLPMNVLFTCASTYNQDEAKRMIHTLALTGKLSKQVQGFMDVVGFMVAMPGAGEGGQSVRRMFVQPSTRYDAKNRLSRYKKEYFDDPTMATILQAVGLLEAKKA